MLTLEEKASLFNVTWRKISISAQIAMDDNHILGL